MDRVPNILLYGFQWESSSLSSVEKLLAIHGNKKNFGFLAKIPFSVPLKNAQLHHIFFQYVNADMI